MAGAVWGLFVDSDEVQHEKVDRAIRQSWLHHCMVVRCSDSDSVARVPVAGLQLSGVCITLVAGLHPFGAPRAAIMSAQQAWDSAK